MASLPELLRRFKKHLGEANSYVVAADVALAAIIGRAVEGGNATKTLEAWARQQGQFLHLETFPDLRGPLASYGRVLEHQAFELFLGHVEQSLRERGAMRTCDPAGADPRPEGEDAFRRVARKLALIGDGATAMPDYAREQQKDRALRQEVLAKTYGRVEVLLLDYYRLVRNGAAHIDESENAAAFFNSFLRAEAEQSRIRRLFSVAPSPPRGMSRDDVVLYSKLLQRVALRLCQEARPDVRAEVMPELRKRFSGVVRSRRRNAIIAALRTEHLLDENEAREYADECC